MQNVVASDQENEKQEMNHKNNTTVLLEIDDTYRGYEYRPKC